MKELRGTATGLVSAPTEECIRFLAAVDRYPTWYPEVVREVEVVERDDEGMAKRANAALHVSYGPLVRSFRLLLAISVAPSGTVKLTRQRHDRSDREQFEVRWRLEEQGGGTRIRVDLEANLSVPRLVPLGGVGEAMAEGFLAAASRALDG